jgi:hypothetical protein
MAAADVAQLVNADELRNGFVNFCVHSAQPGMEKQGLLVFHQKMVELQIAQLSKDPDAKDVRRDFRDDRHAALLNRIFSLIWSKTDAAANVLKSQADKGHRASNCQQSESAHRSI